jgi:hypothetical protein
MREKYCKVSIFVFTVTTFLLLGFFMITTTQAFADNGYKEKGKHKEWQNQKEQHKEYLKYLCELEHRKHFKEQGRHDYKKRPDYHKYHGYREHPYAKHRHYGHYDYKGHRYDYHGHWRSWEQWDGYARKHPHIYKYGGYYREGTHLMFRFCEPGTGNCIFFSIGR